MPIPSLLIREFVKSDYYRRTPSENVALENLTPTQNQALCLIAAGYTNDETARKTGVSLRTIERWKKRTDFQKLLRESVAKTFDATVAELVANSRIAAIELQKIILDEDTPRRVKVSAIQVLLITAAKAKESLLESRLEVIEGLLDGAHQNETETTREED